MTSELDSTAKAREIAEKIKAVLDARTPPYYTPSERWADIEKELAAALEAEYRRGQTEMYWKDGKSIQQLLEAERKAGRDEIKYGITIFYEYFDKHGLRVRISEDALEIKKLGDAEGYRRGLDEAVREAERRMNHTSRSVHACEIGMKQQYEKGFAAAREKAVVIALNTGNECDSIAERIRAMEPDK